LIAYVVVNPTTIRSRPRRSLIPFDLHLEMVCTNLYYAGNPYTFVHLDPNLRNNIAYSNRSPFIGANNWGLYSRVGSDTDTGCKDSPCLDTVWENISSLFVSLGSSIFFQFMKHFKWIKICKIKISHHCGVICHFKKLRGSNQIGDFCKFISIMIDWLVFNANISNISAISWREQILLLNLDTYKISLFNLISSSPIWRILSAILLPTP
jgi:hypothetical protein